MLFEVFLLLYHLIFCLGLLSTFVGFFIFTVIIPAYSQQLQTWTTGASMPTARTEVAGAYLNGKIYVIGGLDETGKTTGVVESYDPITDRWNRVTSLPEPADHVSAAAYNNKLFVFGGYAVLEGQRTPTNKSFMYDPLTDKWQEIKSMPTSRGASTANVIDNTLYVIGGEGSTFKTVGTNEAYDPKSDSWKEKKPMPTKRHHLASVVVDGKLFAIGGRQTDELHRNVGNNEVYDPKSDNWAKVEPMPTKRSGLTAVPLGNDIYVFGGEQPFKKFKDVRTYNNTEIYHSLNDTWTSGLPMPTARHGLVGVGIDGTMYVIGGGPNPGLSFSHANEVLHVG